MDQSVVARSLNRHFTDVDFAAAAAATVVVKYVYVTFAIAKPFTGTTQKTDNLSPIHTVDANTMRRSSHV